MCKLVSGSLIVGVCCTDFVAVEVTISDDVEASNLFKVFTGGLVEISFDGVVNIVVASRDTFRGTFDVDGGSSSERPGTFSL